LTITALYKATYLLTYLLTYPSVKTRRKPKPCKVNKRASRTGTPYMWAPKQYGSFS